MTHIEVVAAIIEDNGRYLATQRGYGEFKDGWEFPGGKIEKGEERETALRREICEELGATIEIQNFLCTVEHTYDTFHLTMHCYICHLAGASHIHLLEHEASQWLGVEELLSVDWLPADVKVVESLTTYLQNNM